MLVGVPPVLRVPRLLRLPERVAVLRRHVLRQQLLGLLLRDLLLPPQNVHCVAYLVENGNSGTKNSVNFVTRLRSVCAAGLPHQPQTSVRTAS